jgi:hypothetical protein
MLENYCIYSYVFDKPSEIFPVTKVKFMHFQNFRWSMAMSAVDIKENKQ